jgi:hypothetical protein
MYNGTSSTIACSLMERSLTYQLPWLNAMLPILLLEELVMHELANSNVSKFIIGGFQQRLGAPWGVLTDGC